MLMAVKNNLRFFKNSLITNLKSILVYKTMFLMQSGLMFVNNLLFITIWLNIFQNAQTDIVTFDDILGLNAICTISYGITYFFFGGVWYINRYIVDCTMDSYLLQPKNVLLNVMLSKCDFSAFGDITSGVFLSFIVSKGDISKMLVLIVFGIFGTVFFLGTEILLRSISVWIGDTAKLSERYLHTLLVNFSSYPETIFPKWIRSLFYTIIPAGFLAHLPFNMYNDFSITKLLIYICAGVIYLVFAIFVFNKAIKSYDSGNAINVRI